METKKKQVFNGQELAMLFQAFSKRIFSRPQKGDIYSKSNYSDDNSCTFYISLSYYDTLLKEFQNAYVQGKFAHSNANITWVNLMNKLIDASNVVDFEEENNLEDYYESVNSFGSNYKITVMSNYLYSSNLQKRFDKRELVSISQVEYTFQNIPLDGSNYIKEL